MQEFYGKTNFRWTANELISEFTKSLILRDFNDVLKDPFPLCIFTYYLYHYQKKIAKIAMHDL